MYETAAHLVDRVPPFIAWRQGVLSCPRWLRLLLVSFPRAARGSAAIFLRPYSADGEDALRWPE